MDWFEKRIYLETEGEVASFGRWQTIVPLADNPDVVDDDTMARFIQDWFGSQRVFGNFLGVGESTVAGWMKSHAFPDYAKRATLLAYFAERHFQELARAKRAASQPMIVKDGSGYMLVRFGDSEDGHSVGEVIARDIPKKEDAYIFASSIRAWELLEEAETLIDEELENRNCRDGDWESKLKEDIQKEWQKTFAPENLGKAKAELAAEKAARKEQKLAMSSAIKLSFEGLDVPNVGATLFSTTPKEGESNA